MATIGGVSYHEDIIRLRGTVHVLIATPGRVIDMVDSDVAQLPHCRILALDEADRLLAQDFSVQIERLISRMHRDRQILLLSATFPGSVARFQATFMPNASVINLMRELTLDGVSQFYAFLEERQKVQCLNTLFAKLEIDQAMIFANSVHRVELLARKITELGYSCLFTHSRMPQEDRNRVFHDFRTGRIRTLVCSDVFTRGIDNQNVNVVINFDFPHSSETYLHRVGRSGRFGHRGIAVSMVTERDSKDLFRVEKELGTQIDPIPEHVEEDLYRGRSQAARDAAAEVASEEEYDQEAYPATGDSL
eukprot:gnl/Ergobibamus_cyprinoides/471.p1 GENE.gnl/Ergobibamus_cyprinoides/471~~gnl/Ergobibamus_cyprinoides/471.p1  ORF type:complete len:306 (+),score=97.45 gnl/Ergobibamus_cyprinoides/471:454-1371(+)